MRQWSALVCMLAVLLLTQPVVGQIVGPAGNAHPESQSLSEVEATNPFGGLTRSTFEYPAQKKAFADEVDLEPLRMVRVQHNGRVKILDTLAREVVGVLTGRNRFRDPAVDEEGKHTELSYDPLFTYLDLMIDQSYYLHKPLIHVEYLPLRERFLDAAYQDEEERELWKMRGRLTPIVVAQYIEPIGRDVTTEPMLRDLGNVAGAMQLFQDGWLNLQVVAPESEAQQWSHLSTLPPGSPGALAVSSLTAAWRAGNAEKVNESIVQLAETLNSINPHMHSSASAKIERVYNAAHPFEWGAWLYALAFVTLLLAFGTGRKWLVSLGMLFFLGALVMHALGFTARCIIAERFAIQNQFESMTGLSLFATIAGTIVMIVKRQWLFGAAAAGVGCMVLLAATQTGIPGSTIEREAAILNTSYLLKYHVTSVLTSYGLISLGFIISLFYLATYYLSRPKAGVEGGEDASMLDVSASALGIEESGQRGHQRVLLDLDTAQMIVLQLAFWVLGVGILLGAWWADHSWGRWWAFDLKELWALITWIIYLIVIHLRFTTGRNRGLVTAWLSVVGFVVMLWTYFGVNLLLPGLHAYA